jgi:hypothetical protein
VNNEEVYVAGTGEEIGIHVTTVFGHAVDSDPSQYWAILTCKQYYIRKYVAYLLEPFCTYFFNILNSRSIFLDLVLLVYSFKLSFYCAVM